MAAQFDLTARLKLVGPVNVKPIVDSIQQQLKGFKSNINVTLGKQFSTNLTATNSALKTFNSTLKITIATSKTATQAFSHLSTAMGQLRQASTAMTQAARPIKQIGQQINQVTHSIEDFGAKSALALKRNAAFLVPTTAIFAFITATKRGLTEALNFEREMVKVGQVTGKSAAGLRDLQKEISSLSTSLGVSSKELVNVSLTLAQAGLKADDVKTILKGLAESSLAPTFDSMAQTTEGVIAAFTQFNLKAKDVESVLGSLNTVSAAYAVESDDLITVIRRTGGAFKAAGGSLNELLALFTSVRSTTRESAETIATGFRTIFTRIQRPKTIEYLREFGVELTDLKGQFVGPYEAIKRLSQGLSSLDTKDIRFAGIIEELGGFRQVSKVIPLISQFAKAQEALGIAEGGTSSLARDAASAQQSLLVQVEKVKEEFADLFRTIAADTGFRAMVKTALALASGIASVSKALTPLIPLFAALGTVKLFSAVPGFLKGFGKGLASGGLVPGHGSGDTVPARLTPGEFVIRKSAVNAIGADNLHKINKYAEGGKVDFHVGQDKEFGGLFFQQSGGEPSKHYFRSDKNIPAAAREAIARQFGIAQRDVGSISGTPQFSFVKAEARTRFANDARSLFGQSLNKLWSKYDKAGIGKELDINSNVGKDRLSKLGFDSVLGHMFEGFIALVGQEFKERNTDAFDFKTSDSFKQGVKPLFGDIPAITKFMDAKVTGKSGGSSASYPDLIKKALNTYVGGGLDIFKDRAINDTELATALTQHKKYINSQPARRATGGNVDNVPALLTPGEFVINKKSAQALGPSKLHALNRLANGGFVRMQHGGFYEKNYYSTPKPESPTTELPYAKPTRGFFAAPEIGNAGRFTNALTLQPSNHFSDYTPPSQRGNTKSVKLSDFTDAQLKSWFEEVKKLTKDSKTLDDTIKVLTKSNNLYTVTTDKVTGQQKVRLSLAAKTIIAEQNKLLPRDLRQKYKFNADDIVKELKTNTKTSGVESAKNTVGSIAAQQIAGGLPTNKLGGIFSKIKNPGAFGILGIGAAAAGATALLPEGRQRNIGQGIVAGATAGAGGAQVFAPLLAAIPIVGTALAGLAPVVGGVVGAIKGYFDAVKQETINIENVRLENSIEKLQEDLGDLDKSIGLTNKQRDALNKLTQERNISSQRNIETLGGSSTTLSDQLFQINPFSSSGARDNALTRTKQIRDERGAGAESNILQLKGGVNALIRSGIGAKALENTKEFKNLSYEAGRAELAKREAQGGIFGKEAAELALKADKNDAQAQKDVANIGYEVAHKFRMINQEAYNLEHKFDGLVKAVNSSIGSLQILGQKFGQAAEGLDRIDDVAARAKDVISGSITAQKFNDNRGNVTIGAPGQESRIISLGKSIGGLAGKDYTKQALDVNHIAATLPKFLEDNANVATHELGEKGLEPQIDKFFEGLHGNQKGGVDYKAIIKDALTGVGTDSGKGRDILEHAKFDPKGAAHQIIGPIVDAMQKLGDDIYRPTVAAAQKLTSSFTELTTITLALGDAQDKIAEARNTLDIHNIEQIGNKPDLNTLLAPDFARKQRLLGGLSNSSPADIATQIKANANSIEKKQEQFAEHPEMVELANQIKNLQVENSNLTKGLEDLANPTSQLAKINSHLAEIENRRLSLASAASDYNKGSASDRYGLERRESSAVRFTTRFQANPQAAIQSVKSLTTNKQQELYETLQQQGRVKEAQAVIENSRGGLRIAAIRGQGNLAAQANAVNAQKGDVLNTAIGGREAQADIIKNEEDKLRGKISKEQQEYERKKQAADKEYVAATKNFGENARALAQSLNNFPKEVKHSHKIEDFAVHVVGLENAEKFAPFLVDIVEDQLTKRFGKEAGAQPVQGSIYNKSYG